MAWAVHREWGAASSKVKQDLSNVVQTIAKYEPVRVLAAPGPALREARREFSSCSHVTVIEAPVDDIWMRDIMPTFAIRGVEGGQEVIAVDWNFNGWGGTRERPPRSGDSLAKRASAIFAVPQMCVQFVGEGGALVTDGNGTMITTRSCLLNPNRNPVLQGINRQQSIEGGLSEIGIQRTIWLEGDPSEAITSGHIDGYILCAPNNCILAEAVDDEDMEPPLWRDHDIAVLSKARGASGKKFNVRTLLAPRRRYCKGNADSFAACYANAYVANGAVIGARFGDVERDEAARTALAEAFPGREIVMLRIDAIANGGGGVHCLTQPMPLAGPGLP